MGVLNGQIGVNFGVRQLAWAKQLNQNFPSFSSAKTRQVSLTEVNIMLVGKMLPGQKMKLNGVYQHTIEVENERRQAVHQGTRSYFSTKASMSSRSSKRASSVARSQSHQAIASSFSITSSGKRLRIGCAATPPTMA